MIAGPVEPVQIVSFECYQTYPLNVKLTLFMHLLQIQKMICIYCFESNTQQKHFIFKTLKIPLKIEIILILFNFFIYMCKFCMESQRWN